MNIIWSKYNQTEAANLKEGMQRAYYFLETQLAYESNLILFLSKRAKKRSKLYKDLYDKFKQALKIAQDIFCSNILKEKYMLSDGTQIFVTDGGVQNRYKNCLTWKITVTVPCFEANDKNARLSISLPSSEHYLCVNRDYMVVTEKGIDFTRLDDLLKEVLLQIQTILNQDNQLRLPDKKMFTEI